MAIAKGRSIKVGNETFTWRISHAEGRLMGTCGPLANFTAQHSSGGSLLTATLESKHWTELHESDLDIAPQHKVSFMPADVSKAIRAAISQGWNPKGKGQAFKLMGVDFTDYRC